jgi:hypothetical protein
MLIDFEQLQSYSKRKRAADIIRWLNDRGIHWTTDGEGKPCTTVTQIDRALERTDQEFDFDGPQAA